MRKELRALGRKFPAWLLALALTVSGVGAAVGTVLAPKIGGEIPVTVSQALLIDEDVAIPVGLSSTSPSPISRWIGTVEDGGTAFTFGMEACNGDHVRFYVYLENKSAQDLVGRVKLSDVPKGITIDISSYGSGDISSVTRVGRYEWLFKVSGSCGAGDDDGLYIDVALADNMKPGFYKIKGFIEPVNY